MYLAQGAPRRERPQIVIVPWKLVFSLPEQLQRRELRGPHRVAVDEVVVVSRPQRIDLGAQRRVRTSIGTRVLDAQVERAGPTTTAGEIRRALLRQRRRDGMQWTDK